MLALSHVVPSKTGEEGNLTMTDLMEFGLMGGVESKALRERIEERLHLGHGNAKTLLRRMNALCIGKEDIEEAKADIAQEKAAAISEIRAQVAELSVKVAEKILRKELSAADRQMETIDRLLDEVAVEDKK